MEALQLRDEQDRLLITPVFILLTALLFIIVWKEIKVESTDTQAGNSTQESSEDSKENSGFKQLMLSRKVALFVIATIVYLLLINILGFILDSFLYLIITMIILENRNKKVLVILPLAVCLVLYLIFYMALDIPLPLGYLKF